MKFTDTMTGNTLSVENPEVISLMQDNPTRYVVVSEEKPVKAKKGKAEE